MNDFTKEELKEILQNIKESEITVGAQRFHLSGKIQSMIDNYCEHESEIDIGEAPMICQKCGKVTG